MVRQMSSGECSVGDLAEPAQMSFAAVSKHVRVLERAGLVNRRVAGRQHFCSLRSEPLREVSEWLAFYERFWTDRLDVLERLLRAEDAQKTPKGDDR